VAPILDVVLAVLRRRLPPAAEAWYARVDAPAPAETSAFVRDFAAASRVLGSGATLEAADRDDLRAAGVAAAAGWRLVDVGRVAMLVAAARHLTADALVALVGDCYAHGDTDERRAVLLALALLPAPERFVSLAVDACRTSVQPLFEAIACENPFAAAHFPAASFNQMVLKAVFTGVALERVVGLEARRTPELRRMAADYASERRAAGRSVPADLERLIGGSER
jgi:hypothetical protein